MSLRWQKGSMRFDGTLTTWHDERGFGFITPRHGGQDIFVHIKAFQSGTGRPREGQQLTFLVEAAPNGKKRALNVQYPVQARARHRVRVESPATWTLPRLLVLPVFAGLLMWLSWRWGFRPLVLLAYGVGSAIAFMAYVVDKSAAVRQRWRLSEKTLHLLGLACGWPGSLLAQQLLRHKTGKTEFVATFWGTVLVNVAVYSSWHSGLLRIA